MNTVGGTCASLYANLLLEPLTANTPIPFASGDGLNGLNVRISFVCMSTHFITVSTTYRSDVSAKNACCPLKPLVHL
jgi:hypothetical protein